MHICVYIFDIKKLEERGSSQTLQFLDQEVWE